MPARRTESYAELERRVLEGDESVTAADLAAAREVDELESLRSRADEHQRRQAELAAAEAARDEVRRDHVEPMRALLAELRPTYAAAVAALEQLHGALGRYQDQHRAASLAARKVGIADEVEREFPALSGEVFNAAVADGRGAPMRVQRGEGPPQLRRHPLHDDDYVEAVNAALAAEELERERRIVEDRERRRERSRRRREERDARFASGRTGLQILGGR